MPRILTIDDSRAIRLIIGKQCAEMGFEVSEAEDGVQGLAQLDEVEFDLVLLDVTMPNMDGPTMLAKMRESGNQTPVLMLTSESKRSIIAEVMKLKIDDYILKPFKNEELKTKMLRALKTPAGGATGGIGNTPVAIQATSSPAADSAGNGSAANGKAFGDILVIDDMENVQKKLRQMIPAHLSVLGAVSAQSGLAMCRERTFRMVVVDRELPDVQSVSLMKQIRVLQPSAACLAMALKTKNTLAQECKEDGWDDLLAKPFSQDVIDDLLINYFDSQELFTRVDDVIGICAFASKEDRLDRAYQRVLPFLKDAIQAVAEACFDRVIVDATKLPSAQTTKNAALVQELSKHSQKFGLQLVMVGDDAFAKSLRNFSETSDVRVIASLADARAAA